MIAVFKKTKCPDSLHRHQQKKNKRDFHFPIIRSRNEILQHNRNTFFCSSIRRALVFPNITSNVFHTPHSLKYPPFTPTVTVHFTSSGPRPNGFAYIGVKVSQREK